MADGLLTYLPGESSNPAANVIRIANYLQLPIQTPPTSISSGDRDAVILEVWREAMNGFQIPDTLIEPALDGPDTTERVHTAMAFRLLRLAAGDTCDSIWDRLKDDFLHKGMLTVSLQPTSTTPGDCPVVEGGGYTGFEHNLYRIEIADVNSNLNLPTMFKWSQFNGGLVGRGTFDAKNRKVAITANLQAIITSGLTDFYLEAVEYQMPPLVQNDSALGYWKVTYGAKVTLNSSNGFDLPNSATFGSIRMVFLAYTLTQLLMTDKTMSIEQKQKHLRSLHCLRMPDEAPKLVSMQNDGFLIPISSEEFINPIRTWTTILWIFNSLVSLNL